MRGWVTVAIKKELHTRIKILLQKQLGYRSIAEFVNDTLQRRLEELEEKIATGKVVIVD